MKYLTAVLFVLSFLPIESGPVGYAICQTGCNALWVLCVSAAGGIAGVSTGGPGVPAAILSCNGGQGFCMSACIAAGLTPIL